MSDVLSLNFHSSAQQLNAPVDSPAWLKTYRSQAKEAWRKVIWPSRKTEHWRYTPLQSLYKKIPQWPSQTAAVSATQISDQIVPIDAVKLVFVNGIFNSELSSHLIPEIITFKQADSAQAALIEKYLGKIVQGDQHLFAHLNDLCLHDGVLVHVKKNQQLSKPIYVIHVSTSSEANAEQIALANHRVLIVLEESASVEVIEHFISLGDVTSRLVNTLTEVVVNDNAQLNHYLLHLEGEQLQHLGGVHADLKKHARFNGFTLGLGSELKRVDYQINHRGQGAELNLNGIYLPRNQQTVDYHTNVQHWVGHCTTQEAFRGIVSDSAEAVFNGRIYIHQDAQKTLAELSNKNLLTSNKATVNTKPELEIYADDVKCAHGATVSQLNTNALFYLQSRGISHADAQVMMSFGFINELLQQVGNETIKDFLLPRLARLFGRDSISELNLLLESDNVAV